VRRHLYTMINMYTAPTNLTYPVTPVIKPSDRLDPTLMEEITPFPLLDDDDDHTDTQEQGLELTTRVCIFAVCHECEEMFRSIVLLPTRNMIRGFPITPGMIVTTTCIECVVRDVCVPGCRDPLGVAVRHPLLPAVEREVGGPPVFMPGTVNWNEFVEVVMRGEVVRVKVEVGPRGMVMKTV